MAKYSNQVVYDIKTTLDASGVTKLRSELSKLNQEVTTIGKTQWGLKDSEIQRTVAQVNRLQTAITECFNPKIGLLDLSKFNKTLSEEKALLGNLNADWAKMGAQGSKAINSLASSILTLNKDAITMNSTLSKIANTFSNTVRWGITASIFQEMMSSVQGAVSYMKNLDESLTNIQMVTGSSKEDMRELAQYANNAAQALGSTTVDYTNAVKVFVQEGFSESESKQYANLSTKLANVSEQNTATTSDQITAYRNAFQLDYEQTVEAMDKVANVANNTASNVNELMTASQRAASVAQAVGAKQDSFLAAIATIESVTRQSAEEIGNGLKTIYQRFADIKTGGTAEDGVDYGQYANALKSIGVDVLDAAGEFKGMDQILKETQEVWSSLDDTMKIAVGEKVAGKFQYNRFAALMNNPEYYQKALGATQGAGGMMDQMNDVYMESIEGRLKTLQSAGEQVMSTLFNQDNIEPIIETATDFLNTINKIIEAVGGGLPVFTAFSGILLRTFNAQIGEQVARISTNIQTSMQASKNATLMDEALGNLQEETGQEGGAIGEIRGVLQKGFSGLSSGTQDQILNSAQELLNAENKVNDIKEKQKLLQDQIKEKLEQSGAAAETLLTEEVKLAEIAKQNLEEAEEDLRIAESNDDLSEEELKEFEKIVEKRKEELDAAEKIRDETQATVELYNQLDSNTLNDLIKLDQIDEGDTNFADKYLENSQQMDEATGNLVAVHNKIEGIGERVDTEKAAAMITDLTGGLMNAIFLVQSFSSLWNTLWDEDLSPQEKATAVLSNMAMTLPILINLMMQLQALKKADTIETIHNTIATIQNSATRIGQNALIAIGTGIWGAETAAKKANAVATGELTIAQWLLNAAMDANPVGRFITALVALIAIFAAVTVGIYALVRSFQDENKKLEEQKAILSDMKSNYDELVSSINELSSAMDSIKNKKDALQGLTKGTTEWKQAVAELNNEILKLLELYPELASYVTTGDNGVLQIDEKGLEEFYNKQLDSAKKLSDATLIQQNKVYEQSNKAAFETFAQNYDIGLFGSGTEKVEAAIKQGKDGIDQLNLTTEEAKTAYYKLLDGVNKNTLAIDTNNNLIGQSNTNFLSTDSSKFEQQAKQNVVDKYGKSGVNISSVIAPHIWSLMGHKNTGTVLKDDEATKEALAEALNVSSSDLKIKNSDLDNFTYQIGSQEPVTKSTDEIIEILTNLEQVELAATEGTEKTKDLVVALGGKVVEIDGIIDHYEDASGHVINSLTDLDLSSLTRTNKYGMAVAETTENLQLKLGLSEEDAANLHDQIQAKINSEGAFKLPYAFEDADEAIEKDELFGKSTLAQFLEGGQTLQYLNELDKALGEDVDAFTLLTDKALNTRLEMVKLEQATNTYNQTLEENQNNTKSIALNDIANQIAELGDESEESNEKLKQLLDNINRENPELLISLGIDYDEYGDVSINEITNQIRDNLLKLTEEDFTISIQAITNLDDTTEDIINSLENVTSAAEKINSDFTVSYSDLEDVVAAFPGILGENEDAYQTYADGTIQLNADIAQAAIDSAQTDKNATVEAQINKIEAQKAAISAAIIGYQTELDAAIEKNNQEGLSEAEREQFIHDSVERIAGYNDALANASIEASKEMSIASQKLEIEREQASADATNQIGQHGDIASENFSNMLANIAKNVFSFIGKVISPLGDAIISALTGKSIDDVASDIFFGGSSSKSVGGPGGKSTSTSITPYTSIFGGLGGYVEYLQQDKKILENNLNQLNAQEAKLRAIQGKSIQQSDIANKPDKNNNNNNNGGKDNSGSTKDTRPKDEDKTEWDYLTDITNDLDRAAAAMEKLAKLEDRLYGKNRVSQIKKLQGEYKNYIKLLEQEVKLAEQHAERLRTNAYDENGNLTVNGYAYRAGFSQVNFDAQGNLENGKAIEAALVNIVNTRVAEYNAHRNDDDASYYEERVQLAQKDHEGFMKALSDYESTLGTIEDGQSQIQDYKEKIQDAADEIVDAIQDGIEDMVEAIESQREFNKMYRDWMQGGNSYSHFGNDIQYYTEGLEGILSSRSNSQSIFDMQLANLQDRIKDVEDVFDNDASNADDEKLSEQAAFENLQEATSNIMDNLDKVIEYYDSLLEVIENASSKMDELIDGRLDEFDKLSDYLDTRFDQVKLLFGENSYDQQVELYNQKIAVDLEKMVSINTAIEAKQATVEALEKLEASGKELSTEERKELQSAREKVNDLQQQQLDTETKLLQEVVDRLGAQTSAEMKKLGKELFGGTDVEWLSQQWEIATKLSDKYFDDYNRAFELQKMELKFQEALNDNQNSSIEAQQKINDLSKEYLTYLREKKNLSEYDIKHAQAALDILQKQIALQDLQNNKSQMQLQRNAAGNYDFVYAADESAIEQAKNELLIAQQDLYNLSKQMYTDIYSGTVEMFQQCQDMVVQIITDTSLSVDERAERIQYVFDSLNEYLGNSSIELSEISVNLYNSFVEAEQLITEENQGALAAIFEQMRQDSIQTKDEIINDSIETKDATITDMDEIQSTFLESLEQTKGGIGDFSATFSESLDQIQLYANDKNQNLKENILNSISDIESGIIGNDGSLKKIRVGTNTEFGGINTDIQTILTTIDKRFELTEKSTLGTVDIISSEIDDSCKKISGLSISTIEDIDSKLQNEFKNTDSYLRDFGNLTEQILRSAGDNYQSFTRNSVDYSNIRLGELRNTTQNWRQDLNNLNLTINIASSQMNTWKGKIDGAIKSAEILIPRANTLQGLIGANAVMAGIATDGYNNFEGAAYRVGDAVSTMASRIQDGYYSIANAANTAAGAYDNMRGYANAAEWAANDAAWAAREAADAINMVNSLDSERFDIGATVNNIKNWFGNTLNGFSNSLKNAFRPSTYNPYENNIWALGNTFNFMDTGGYTGTWNDRGIGEKNGKLAVLHEKELVLNAHDTENMLSAVELVRDIMSGINTLPSFGKTTMQQSFGDTIKQRVEINATFPGVTEAIEIKQALEQLADNAYQVANKYTY